MALTKLKSWLRLMLYGGRAYMSLTSPTPTVLQLQIQIRLSRTSFAAASLHTHAQTSSTDMHIHEAVRQIRRSRPGSRMSHQLQDPRNERRRNESQRARSVRRPTNF
ncbi:hypothetical protein AB1N83_014295 [Pleurotus pulmonarius]